MPRVAFPLRSHVLLTDLRPTSPLPLGSLPPLQFPPTTGIAAVALVPTLRLVDATTSFAQAGSRPKPLAAGGWWPGDGMLIVSQGRCFLPQGPPEELAKVPRASFFPAVPAGRCASLVYQARPTIRKTKETQKDTSR